jgi:hypothetical protein
MSHKLNLRHKRYSEKELEDNCHLFDNDDWADIADNQSLTQKFMEKHSDKIDWDFIALSQKMTAKFIKKHISKIEITYLMVNPRVSKKVKEEIKTLKEII